MLASTCLAYPTHKSVSHPWLEQLANSVDFLHRRYIKTFTMFITKANKFDSLLHDAKGCDADLKKVLGIKCVNEIPALVNMESPNLSPGDIIGPTTSSCVPELYTVTSYRRSSLTSDVAVRQRMHNREGSIECNPWVRASHFSLTGTNHSRRHLFQLFPSLVLYWHTVYTPSLTSLQRRVVGYVKSYEPSVPS
jgi:hypothetical protein